MNLFLISLFLWSAASTTPKYVSTFHAIETAKEEQAFLSTYADQDDPGIEAYVLTIRIKQLSNLMNPYSKWKGFKKHTARMNKLAKDTPNNIHVRYCRLMIQEQSPSFLGYDDYLEADKKFLRSKLKTKDDTDYMDTFIRENTSL